MNRKILILSLLLLLVFIAACGKKEQQKTATTTTTLQQETPLQNDVDDLDNTITGLDDSSLQDIEDFNDL